MQFTDAVNKGVLIGIGIVIVVGIAIIAFATGGNFDSTQTEIETIQEETPPVGKNFQITIKDGVGVSDIP